MRRDIKATVAWGRQGAGFTTAAARDKEMHVRRLATALLAIAALTMAFGAAQASADAPTFDASFDGSTITPTPANEFTPRGVAVDEASGDVYVIDSANNAVRRFSASGAYKSSLLGSSITGSESFNFSNSDTDTIAVDNSGGPNAGNVYVVGEPAKITAFDKDGVFLWQVEEEGANNPCGVATDSTGTPWVTGYFNGVAKHDPATGAVLGGYLFGTGLNACQLAIDGNDNVYLNVWHGSVLRFPAPGYGSSTTLVEGQNFGLAADTSTNEIYVNQGTQVAVYSSAGSLVSGTPFGSFTEAMPPAVNAATGKIYIPDAGTKTISIYDRAVVSLQELNVAKAGSGAGKVTSSPAGIDCGSNCGADVAEFEEGTVVTLTQSASAGSKFIGWSGDCTGTGTCEVTMSAAKSVTATFDDIPDQTLTVTKAGTGSGTVTSSPAGINCGSTCAFGFEEGSEVTLTAAPAAHSTVSGWTGCASNPTPSTCKVTMSAAKAVTATFALDSHTLAIVKAGTGSGSVTCNGVPCAASYPYGTTLTLAASAASGSSFAGWSGGGCSGSGLCTLKVEANTAVTATFNTNPVTPPSNPSTGNPPASNPPSSSTPPPTTTQPPAPKPLKCKKGFKKKKVKGKTKCVKVKKHKKAKR